MRAWSCLAWCFVFLLAACGSDGSSKVGGNESAATDAENDAGSCPERGEPDANAPKHKLSVRGKLTQEAEGVPFFAQNGARVHVAAKDIVGKRIIWATTAGGESIANADFLEAGGAMVSEDLSFAIDTKATYVDGPYEFSMVIIVSDSDSPPQPGDLASWSFDGIEPCDPPATGVSVRFNVHGKDAHLELGNNQFIRF